MIKISHLNKIYKSKRHKKCHALHDINLTLPDNGLVFVLGKSGSGKSTLLNLIGGLDNVTSGSINVDGNDLAKFKEKDFCNYRNSHIGFIFQDYHLIDELTVFENIRMSLDLENKRDDHLITDALARVDLAGYEERFPTELSGGEQQRVAIARAIVKKPRIILADEPTGNLDTSTAKAIVELLKELSKECLILIVSHNINDANNYADRIIELKKGQVIADKSRNPQFLDKMTLDGDKLIYPDGLALADEDIAFINDNKNANFVKKTDKFLPTDEPQKSMKKVQIANKNLNVGRQLNISGKFLKNKAINIAFSAFMVAVIMVIMALAQTIINFDAGQVIANEMDKMDTDSVYMLKMVDAETKSQMGENARDYFVEVSKQDVQKFYDNGYNGKIYPVYNFFMPITYSTAPSAGWNITLFNNSIYPEMVLGVVCVDEQFLVEKFGKVEYLARLDTFHPAGIVITDYVADAICWRNRAYKGKDYSELLGDYIYGPHYSPRGYINGIIKTGYREKYGEFLDGLDLKNLNMNELLEDEQFLALSNEVYGSLGLGYSFEEDFETSFEQNYTLSIAWHHKLWFDEIDYSSTEGPQVRRDEWLKKDLAENEIMMHYYHYNQIFGTEYTSKNLATFKPHKTTIRQYRYDDIKQENVLLEIEVDIVGLFNHTDRATMIASDEIFDKFAKNYTFVAGLYFDGNENIDTVIETAKELGLTHYNSATEGIHTMTKAVEVFVPIFELVAIFLCVGVVFILMNFSTKMIKDKMHEIGILKALGAKNSSICVIFGLQVALITLLTCILATSGYYLFIDLANDVLIESLARIAPSRIVMDLDFLIFQPKIAFENCLLVVCLAVVSLLVPMIKIKKIKPVKIIKAKD